MQHLKTAIACRAKFMTRDNKHSFLISLLSGVVFGCIFTCLILINFKNNVPDNLKKKLITANENYLRQLTNTEETGANENQNISLLCWIMTQPRNHATKAVHVKTTWGKRCNILLFMSSKEDVSLPAIKLRVWEDRQFLWSKTKYAFKYVYKHYFDKADWFLKADDDTYVIIENLKYLLSSQSTLEPVFLGFPCNRHDMKQGFLAGGAGYVLSKTTLRKFITEALPDYDKCQFSDIGDEDVEISKCMENIGVKVRNTRDSIGKERFFQIPTELILSNVSDNKALLWYNNRSYYPPLQGHNCCSDAAISFHYITPEMMYVIEKLVYQLKPHAIYRKMDNINISDISP
ncbi:hypothetical protein O3M35_012348 [Rhynocoris fuscipes]|uniref:Glycoprotein-N-acetylgalactosamine 3-beta-galactosyltransferase 1 n=1 Tax=Rhynocoris fuscipes TaxID=488301 RepID=A0AAW1CSU6_9HEMI